MPKNDIGFLIKCINDKMKVKADADLKHFDLTFSQSRVLAFLSEKGGTATQKDIEVFLEVSHPTVVGIVSRMEQNGHVTTWFDERDKRNKMVQLTPKAVLLGNEMESNIQLKEKAMLRSISPSDVEKLKQLLTAVYKNIE